MVFLLGITVLASTVYYVSNKALEKIDYDNRLTQVTYLDIN